MHFPNIDLSISPEDLNNFHLSFIFIFSLLESQLVYSMNFDLISWVNTNPDAYLYQANGIYLPTLLLTQLRSQFELLLLGESKNGVIIPNHSLNGINFRNYEFPFHKEETTFQTYSDVPFTKENWYHYMIFFQPNIKYSIQRSSIFHDGCLFYLNGFSLFSPIELEDIPFYALEDCGLGKIFLKRISFPPTFSSLDVKLIQSYLLLTIMGLPDNFVFRHMYIYPLFVHPSDNFVNKVEVDRFLYVLSPHLVLIGLMHNIQDIDLSVTLCINELVYNSNVLPKVFRIDHFDLGKSKFLNTSLLSCVVQSEYDYLQSTSLSWLNTVNVIENQPNNVEFNHHDKLKSYSHILFGEFPPSSFDTLSLNMSEYKHTGLYPDISVNVAAIFPMIFHIRYHKSLKYLRQYLQIESIHPLLLQCCLTHNSFRRNVSNIGIPPALLAFILSKTGCKNSNGNYCISQYFKFGKRNYVMRYDNSRCDDNERFEFLGDAVIEYLTTLSLFHLFPNMSEGPLSIFRSSIVQNSQLFRLADHLHLNDFLLIDCPAFFIRSKCKFIKLMADALEAIFGLIFVEHSISECQCLLGRLLWWGDLKLNNIWISLPEYPVITWSRSAIQHQTRSTPVFEKLKQFEQSISIDFSFKHLLAKAFTQPSIPFNILSCGSNGTLEFLGDSILQLAISKFIFMNFPHCEGVLSNIRSSIVNNLNLANIGKELNVQPYIILQPHEFITNTMISDVLESLIAVIYLDKGMQYVDVFCQSIFFKSKIIFGDINSKLKLLLYTKICYPFSSLTYVLLNEEGPTNNANLSIGIYFGSQLLGIGQATTRKLAESRAACEALKNIKCIRELISIKRINEVYDIS